MPATIEGSHLGLDTHANRPAANAAGQPFGALYSCSTHSLIYKTDGSTWATYATLGAAASGSITASGYTQNTARLLGRTTASSGAIEEITVGSGLSLAGGSLTATGGATLTAASYTRSTGDYTTTSTSFADVDGTNLALTIATGAHRVLVGMSGSVSNSGSTFFTAFTIAIDGTDVESGAELVRAQTSPQNILEPVSFSYLTNALTAASHTFKLRWKVDGNTATLYGNSTICMRFWVVEQGV